MTEVVCPWCGEPSTIDADLEDDESTMDCPVCCRPWFVRVRDGSDGPEVTVSAEGG